MASLPPSSDNPSTQDGGNDKSIHDRQQLTRLRDILNNGIEDRVVSRLKTQQREMVRDIITESLHDRQQHDGSIQKVIQPMVAKSVEKSIASQKSEFINYLYPIVGSLVRKSVTAFISDFIEKTNELIENSFSLKGFKWRVQAWRTGVSFSEYVASQTFLYQIQQVFLIHKETGTLLHSVFANNHQNQDADVVSAMLTAINDFVSDSFTGGEHEQHLDVIKTDEFTLLLKSTPQIMLVAAYTGNISPTASQKLQLTLEDIHRLYQKQLSHFEGDITAFKDTDAALSDCLLQEERSENSQRKKLPIWGLLVFVGIVMVTVWYMFGWWQTHQVADDIKNLPKTPGIAVTQLHVDGFRTIELSILRDSYAQSSQEWLTGINTDFVNIVQTEFISLDRPIVLTKIAEVVSRYPTVNFDTIQLSLIGDVRRSQRQALLNELQVIPGYAQSSINLSALNTVDVKVDLSASKAVLEQTFVQLVGEISKEQVSFESGESDLQQSQLPQLSLILDRFNNIQEIAGKLNRSVSLIIVGASDTSGESAYNKTLSQNRAQNVKQALVSQGADSAPLFAIGIGEVNLEGDVKATRIVLFNIIFSDLDNVTNQPES